MGDAPFRVETAGVYEPVAWLQLPANGFWLGSDQPDNAGGHPRYGDVWYRVPGATSGTGLMTSPMLMTSGTLTTRS